MRPVHLILITLILLIASPIAHAQTSNPKTTTDTSISLALEAAAKAERIPTVLLKGLAWRMSHWKQFSFVDTPLRDGDRVGMLGVPAEGRKDREKLEKDWHYNITQGAKHLALMFYRCPIVGNGRQEDGRNILECWYLALGKYGSGHERGPENQAFADSVLQAIASGGEGRWEPVTITRPSAEQLTWGRSILGPPAPWHFGDVPERPRPGTPGAEVKVDLPIPYLSQVWDTPDAFNGGGACGPTSMLMVLAYCKKLPPKPVTVHDSYFHVNDWGGHIPDIEQQVCEPSLGAVHVRMLDYLRPHFPSVAIFYDDKATYARVKRELDAGRPVILGTQVTPAGHLMVARGYLADGRLLCNDPAGNYYESAQKGSPLGLWSPTGNRYWNGNGERAVYDWEALAVRWVMTFDSNSNDADRPEDEDLRKP